MTHNRIAPPKSTDDKVSRIMRRAEAAKLESTKMTCQFQYCTTTTFLHSTCNKCGLNLCGEHLFYESHNCTKYTPTQRIVPTCPLCNQIIRIPPKTTQPPDYYVNLHIQAGCKPVKQTAILPAVPKHSKLASPAASSNKVLYPCHHENCSEQLLIPDTCKVCELTYCRQHKWTDSHKCPGPPKNSKKTVKSSDSSHSQSKSIVSSIFSKLGLSSAASSTTSQGSTGKRSQGRKIGGNAPKSKKSTTSKKSSKKRSSTSSSRSSSSKSSTTAKKPNNRRPPPRQRD